MPKYGINKAVLLGNVGTEPELRYLDQGVAVCNFRLATTERFKKRDGNWDERTDWHNIVLWRQRAELAHKYLKVGSGVYLEGRIVSRSWDGPDGQKRYKTEVEVDKMRLLDSASPGPPDSAPTSPKAEHHSPVSSPEPKNPPAKPEKTETPEDDLPF